MNKTQRIVAVAMVFALAAVFTPLLAGEGKCDHEAQGCLNYLAQKLEGRGWAGVDMDHSDGAPRVTTVFDGTPADKSGVKVGDVLLAINGVKLNEENHEKLGKLEGKMKPGATFTYTISRNGKEKDITLALEAMPADAMATIVGKHMLDGHASIEVASN